MIIDFHAHVFSPAVAAGREKYSAADQCFAALYSSPRAKLRTAEELILEMDSSGIDTAVIQNIAWTSHELCVESNDYLMEAAKRHAGRLVPFVSIQPADGRAIGELTRCAAAGARGVGELRPDVQGFDLNDRKIMDALVKTMVKHNLVFSCHADEPLGHTYPGKGGVTPGALYPFIERYPKLKIVLSHWGGGLPFYVLMPEVRAALRNVWFDSAATPFLYDKLVYERVVDLLGEKKILFGTDWPLLTQRRCLDEVRSLDLSTQTINAILGLNARDLLEIEID